MRRVRQAWHLLCDEGPMAVVKRTAHFIYKHHIRTYSPATVTHYNGQAVKAGTITDRCFPWFDPRRPNYESGIITALNNHLSPGDSVVIVGGGYGVTAVEASNLVGESGCVKVFEGSRTQIRRAKETAELNETPAPIEFIYGVVGEAVEIWEGEDQSPLIPASELPECDVLQLDCEGAEKQVLQNLETEPYTLIVESHTYLGSPPDLILDLLREKGYSIINHDIADADQQETCRENGIWVFTAKKK